MVKTDLDFLVIGAQKCGTTTLWQHLREHPDVFMPAEKELPFFSHDEQLARGWEWFVGEYFREAPEGALWGKASPQYMTHAPAAERIAERLPEVKLIAVLRHPIERAYSHFRMSVRRGIDERDFEAAVADQLTPAALDASRAAPDPINSYVVRGEYGRALAGFREHFAAEQILVLELRDLAARPRWFMGRVYEFLGLEPVFPESLGQVFHQGGNRQRFGFVKPVIRSLPRKWIKRALPARVTSKLGAAYFQFDQWNTLADAETGGALPLSSATYERLCRHFEADAERLRQATEMTPSWLPFAPAEEALAAQSTAAPGTA